MKSNKEWYEKWYKKLSKMSREEIYDAIMDAWHRDEIWLERTDLEGNKLRVTSTQWRQYCYENASKILEIAKTTSRDNESGQGSLF